MGRHTDNISCSTRGLTAVAKNLESWEKTICVMASRATWNGSAVSSCSVRASSTRSEPLVNPTTATVTHTTCYFVHFVAPMGNNNNNKWIFIAQYLSQAVWAHRALQTSETNSKLYSILERTGNQWSFRRRGCTWSHFQAFRTSLAEVFLYILEFVQK